MKIKDNPCQSEGISFFRRYSMTAKDYLSQARYLDMRITSKLEQIDSLNELATRCTSTISDMPRNPNQGGSRMADAVIKIIDLEEQLKKDISKLVDLKREIGAVINAVDNPDQQTLLEKRYLCMQSWEQIAVDMNYGIDNIFKLHKKALQNVTVPEGLQ